MPKTSSTGVTDSYPTSPGQRSDWIHSRRSARHVLDPNLPYHFLTEDEQAADGRRASVTTIFLTNRECPWQCLMCDLWKNTLNESLPPGAIPRQIDHALQSLKESATATGERDSLRQLKLYNSGSFFDPRAIPPEDYPEIVRQCQGFERVIVECHPSLVNDRVLKFRDLLTTTTSARLELALGLETAHPEVLDKLNKRMTLEQFTRAASFLNQHDLALRVFVLVQPPFQTEEEVLPWAQRSVDFAFDRHASVVSLIPTRLGNGALEALARQGQFAEPRLATLETVLDYGLSLKRGRVLADLWDLERFSDCEKCFSRRRTRLDEMNLTQRMLPPVRCSFCDSTS